MKLISLYIENFGGLSRYSLSFEDGLTVIEAENGFGKTTLAEFVRAMFYGFPRKGKTLDKSRRQKYTPWNGGRFGGNLVFEADGNAYRLERTFGATPKGDSFSLIDLATNRKSSRFTESIGLELFGLDADAYERSTYLPQMAETDSLTTDSIRSKLSNLVEDTNDVGNFEKAVAALKTKRSTYVPYRGSGGSVAQAVSRISQLQEQLNRAEGSLPKLDDCTADMESLERDILNMEETCRELRQRSRIAAEAAAIEAVHRQEAALVRKTDTEKEKKLALEAKYPTGIPNAEALDDARERASRLELLKHRQVADQEDRDAEAFLQENRVRFEGGVPTAEELEACRGDCRNYEAWLAEAAGKGLSHSEKELESRLKPLFDRGLLEEEHLDELAKLDRTYQDKRNQRQMLELSEEDRQRTEALEIYFASGVPGEMTLRQKQGELDRLRQLQQELARLEEAASGRSMPKTNPLPMALLLVLGAGATAAGVVLLVKSIFLWGGIALGAGILAVFGGIFAGIRLMLAREKARAMEEEQQRIQGMREKIRQADDALSEFTAAYSTDDNPDITLCQIRDRREDYLVLLAKQREIREKQRLLDDELETLAQGLRRELGDVDFTEQILNLRLSRGQYLDLQNQRAQAQTEAAQLREKAAEVRQKIRQFLNRFGMEETGDLYGDLARLGRSADAYLRAGERVRRMHEAIRTHQRNLADGENKVREFFDTWGIPMGEDPQTRLLQIRDDRKDWMELTESIALLEQELAQFREENAVRLVQALPETVEDPENLRKAEQQQNLQLKQANQNLLSLQQKQQLLQAEADQIPQLQDDLAAWQEKRAADQRSADILDETMAFLEQAKEDLSNSYLGPIRRSFGEYLHRLWEDQSGQTLVTQDLDVLLERYGQVRELGYFSAGQADLVMLCMRFALVDALFEEENPCVILDDPFVNLDDRHTKQALELLKELSQNRQILYLTCSTSRTPN